MMSLMGAVMKIKDEKEGIDYAAVREYMRREFPLTMSGLRFLDQRYTTVREVKGYTLSKRDNNRQGFVYYVRYRHGGKELSTKWSTGTNDFAAAEKFARENRERLVKEYLEKKSGEGLRIIEKYYDKGSEYYAQEEKRNRPLCDAIRKEYGRVIKNKFIPYLKRHKICNISKISLDVLEGFQDELLKAGIKPQTVNDNMKAVRRVFAYLARKKHIRENPCMLVKNIPVRKKDVNNRGCVELGKIKGVFDKRWKSEENRLLNMIVYTTGMRNSEISRIKLEDIVEMRGVKFVEVKESKTESGERMVPLHENVYRAIKAYAKNKKRGEEIFSLAQREKFGRAALLEDLDERGRVRG